MFLTELSPLMQQLTQQPVAFLGGFVTGVLRLSLADEPVRTWLNQQTGTTAYPSPSRHSNGNGSGPQSISID